MLYSKKYPLLTILLLTFILFISACSNSSSANIENKSKIETNTKVLRVSYNKNGLDKEKNANEQIHNQDRWESFNRRIFRLNKGLDTVLVKPAAKAYKFVTPEIIDKSVSNFFSNIGDVGNAFNNLLQFKPADAINDSARFLFNSTFGLAGFLDIASEMELEKHDEDFGQTLAKWGVGSGPYLMLPFLGPSTVRDAGARFSIDAVTDPVSYQDEAFALTALKILDIRADLLLQEEAFKGLADDEYSAVRDAWLQRREYLIRDGAIDKQGQSDLIDELESLDDE